MATIYNQVGSLIELRAKLSARNIRELQTLEEIRLFRNNAQTILSITRQKNKNYLAENIKELESEYERLITELENKLRETDRLLQTEKTELDQQISLLTNAKKGIFLSIVNGYKRKQLLEQRNQLEANWLDEINRACGNLYTRVKSLKDELDDKKANTNLWIERLSEAEFKRAKLIQSTIEDNITFLYGAEGEERAQAELSKLPDTYVVINDFERHFTPPIYDRQKNDRILSIQIDHIVVGPTGIYLIETKNWSKESINNQDYFSPVKQIRRSGYAMYILLNRAVTDNDLEGFEDKWGEQQISPKQIVLLMDHKPHEEYQHVRILTVNEVRNYILRGDNIFTDEAVKSLVNFLMESV